MPRLKGQSGFEAISSHNYKLTLDMKGQILWTLLDSRQKIAVPGLGVFSTESRPAEIQFGAGRIAPPNFRVDFNQRNSQEHSTELRDCLTYQFGLNPSKADQLISDFVSEVRQGLANDRKYHIQGFGTLASDIEGNVQFMPLEATNYDLNSFGLRPLSAISLHVKNRSTEEKEVPVIPLRPFDDLNSLESGKKKKSRFPSLAYAAVGTGLALAAGSMIWLSSLNPDANPSASIVPEIQKVQTSKEATVQGLSKSPAENVGLASTQKQASPEESLHLNFFVVAGSFKNFQIAEDAEKEWNGNGFQTSFHKAEDKGMMRVAIGQFQSKEDALAFLSKSQSSFNSQLWILKEEKAN